MKARMTADADAAAVRRHLHSLLGERAAGLEEILRFEEARIEPPTHNTALGGIPVTDTRTLPHDDYIRAVEAALADAKMVPERADTFVEDSYDVPYLRAVITLTPETFGIPAERYPHGLILIWDWHTGRDQDYDRGAAWQWARLNEDGSNRFPYEPLPVPGWVAPAMLTAAAATLAHTGTATPMNSGWHNHLRAAVETACETWGAGA
jgi:hypothetical protein